MTTKEQELTIRDACLLEGAAAVVKRYSHHLRKHVGDVITNYESTDFDRTTFLADVAYAIGNIDAVVEAAGTMREILEAIRAEVASTFNNEEDEE